MDRALMCTLVSKSELSKGYLMKQTRKVMLVLASIAVLSGCTSGFTTLSPTPPQQYTRLGHAEGSACGSLGIVSTSSYFIPMGLNSRVERAYNNAVASVPGATALVDVTAKEDWTWWLIGTARCITVTGEAIK
jgi:uncharacterized lipoprotein YajG